MSMTLQQMSDEWVEDYAERMHNSVPEPEPYPTTEGYEVEYIEVMPVEHWVPACGGTELPFTVNGTRWQYMYCPETGQHGYYNLDTDIIETDRDFTPY